MHHVTTLDVPVLVAELVMLPACVTGARIGTWLRHRGGAK